MVIKLLRETKISTILLGSGIALLFLCAFLLGLFLSKYDNGIAGTLAHYYNAINTAQLYSIRVASVLNFVAIIIGFVAAWQIFGRLNAGRDLDDREVSSKIEQSERRIYQDVRREFLERAEKELVGTDLITQVLERKLQDGMLVTLDKALKAKLDAAASKVHALNHIDETLGRIRIKLDGPSSRAERAAGISRILAYAFAVFGVVLATYRVLSLDLPQPSPTAYDWPTVAMKAGPWVGLVLLVEFTALLFLRFYNRSIELQRYFTRELAGIESQFLGLKVAIDVGGRIDGVRASAALLKVEPASFVEDTQEELSTLTKAIESMADVIKKLKPAAEAGA
ncbi:hypothetical protein AB9E29_31370 [Rhizobium leguminosarum]|uniref:hypothetical protein n=1 Tax=Rhizobium leguminosarum TaxID=384 RepID=UPI003F9C970A